MSASPVSEYRFRLFEGRDATRRDDWSIETRGVDGVFDFSNQRN
jgi:hypothetical protein